MLKFLKYIFNSSTNQNEVKLNDQYAFKSIGNGYSMIKLNNEIELVYTKDILVYHKIFGIHKANLIPYREFLIWLFELRNKTTWNKEYMNSNHPYQHLKDDTVSMYDTIIEDEISKEILNGEYRFLMIHYRIIKGLITGGDIHSWSIMNYNWPPQLYSITENNPDYQNYIEFKDLFLNKERLSYKDEIIPASENNDYKENELYVNNILLNTKQVYITQATLSELRNSAHLRNRKKLIFHISPSCNLANNDYVVDGEIIAYNSGVIRNTFNSELKLCKSCGYKKNICSRCGGGGKLLEYKHVLGGKCFKCRGAGVITYKLY